MTVAERITENPSTDPKTLNKPNDISETCVPSGTTTSQENPETSQFDCIDYTSTSPTFDLIDEQVSEVQTSNTLFDADEPREVIASKENLKPIIEEPSEMDMQCERSLSCFFSLSCTDYL